METTDSPAQPTASTAPKTQGKAIAALILGICSLIIPFAGPVCGIIAIILGAMSMKAINASAGRLTGKPMAIIGLILGILGLIASTVITISVLGLFTLASMKNSALITALPLA